MTSRPFPAKFDSTCPQCRGKIVEGMTVVFADRDAKDPVHETCPKSQTSSQGISAAAIPSKPVYVQIAAWVTVDDAPRIIEVIRALKNEENK